MSPGGPSRGVENTAPARVIMMKRVIRLFLFSLSISLLSGVANAPQKAWAEDTLKAGEAVRPTRESGFNIGLRLVTFYRDTFSAVDGDRCPSVPSCSSYSIDAFRKHGFFVGWMMTVDRLIHEGEAETRVSPTLYSRGGLKIFDPVENNDFWWHARDRKDHD